jgi:SAM-dependent methyltransferase
LLKENLDPGHAAAAVFLGIFIGIVPIYGFQTLAAVGVALLFRLNKPLTVAGTFINNPLLLPLIVVASVDLGYFLRGSPFPPLNASSLTGAHLKEELLAWVIGSVPLGILVGGVGAAITALVIQLKAPANPGLRDRIRFVNGLFARCARADRGFVRWKLRLDRIFGLLAAENLGSGTVVDLGCGYGMALGFAAFGDSSRRLVGCDLDAHRIAVARQALGALNADLSVADVRRLDLPPAGLILILDVLQYLPADDQQALLQRCCSALAPQGMLIFRVHDCERGLWSTITMAFDRLIFACGRAGVRPLMLSAAEYHSVLENAGMQVEQRRFRNRLPLAHILFIAKKPLAESAP